MAVFRIGGCIDDVAVLEVVAALIMVAVFGNCGCIEIGIVAVLT